MKRKRSPLEFFIIGILAGILVFLYFLLKSMHAFCLPELHFLIFWGSVFATFLSTVLSREQDERIRNGAFGALAAGGITAIVTLVQKEQTESVIYLCYSFFGSALGAFLGWMLFVLISIVAYFRYGKIVPFVELITNGFGKFREQIITLESNEVFNYLKFWFEQYSGELNKQVSRIEKNDGLKQNKTLQLTIYKTTIRFILMSLTELFNLVFGTIKFRATVIRFRDENQIKVGYHDFEMSYYGIARRFRELPFNSETKAHEMVSNKITDKSKTFDLNKSQSEIPSRDSRDRYVSFTLFRLNANNVLSIDWAQEGAKERLEQLEDLMNDHVIPTLTSLIEKVEHLEKDIEKHL